MRIYSGSSYSTNHNLKIIHYTFSVTKVVRIIINKYGMFTLQIVFFFFRFFLLLREYQHYLTSLKREKRIQ